MIFVDTNLFVYAVGRDHPLKEPARAFFQNADRYPHLTARDLVHLACCRRRNVRRVKSFDRGLAAAFRAPSR